MRKYFICLFAIALLLNLIVCSPTSAKTSYPGMIERQIKELLKETRTYFDSSKPVKVVKMVKTPKKHYYTVLFTYYSYSNDHLGSATFKKEKDGYTFINGMDSTVQKLNNNTMYLDKVPYSVVYGYNEGNRIQSLRLFTLDKKSSYTAPIKKGTYFVHFKKLPPNTDIEKMKPFFIDCYGKDNKLIPWAECAE
ncbi:hypothetical protein [Priestia megaterium]|uniref:hypothetical protein n=1 Tax=Priestia megaterium TaxID=1404 RepID=UPI00237A61DF|nr:hypothetical protein [Priestia megaterium]MDD9791442.1 hypothetical protein [Priestia megaterium]